MKEIRERNLSYIELSVKNTKKAAYILTEGLGLDNFRIMDERNIRIYEAGAAVGEIIKALAVQGAEVAFSGKRRKHWKTIF